MPAKLRVGIMSFAHVHADGYTQLLQSMPDIEFVGFSDTDVARGEQAAQIYGAKLFSSHESLVAQQLDAVIVCCENVGRRRLVELAAQAGSHVLCEKPIEATLEDALAMGEACSRAGVNFMTAFPMRFDPSIRLLRERIQNGDLGRIYAANGINHSEIPRRHRAWFAQKNLAGGGAIMDHTVHLTDLFRWLFESEVLEVHAVVGNPFFANQIDVDSAGLVTLGFENQMFAGIDCSWSRPETYPRWGHLKLEVIGEKGALEVDAFAQHLNVYTNRLTWQNWGSDPNRAMLEEFFASIRQARAPSVTWQDGFEALRVALACYASNDAKQPVKIERTSN
jgi:UDP-N-acetylglucosamine 3-dehydrogenase